MSVAIQFDLFGSFPQAEAFVPPPLPEFPKTRTADPVLIPVAAPNVEADPRAPFVRGQSVTVGLELCRVRFCHRRDWGWELVLEYGDTSAAGPFWIVPINKRHGLEDWIFGDRAVRLVAEAPVALSTDTVDREALYDARNEAQRALDALPLNGEAYMAALREIAVAQKALGTVWR